MKTIKKLALYLMINLAPVSQLISYPATYQSYPVYTPIYVPTYTYQTPIIYPYYTPYYYYGPLYLNLDDTDMAQASLKAILITAILALSVIAIDSISR